jgi:DmsE family decaheme c-type cytochrome
MTLVRALKPVLFLSMGLGLMGILAARPRGLLAEDPPQQGQAAQAGGVSNADCAVCHEDVVKAFDKNPHAVLEKSPKFNLKNSCESCHGPGQAHVDGGGDKTKIITFKEDGARGAYNRQCLACHKDTRQLNGFSASMHGKQGISCVECHGVHKSALTTQLLKQPTNDLCFGCHIQRKADFARPYHHRVPEKAMRCTDCHQPHTGLDRAMHQVSLNGSEPCFQCHREKEGPFVFEHAGLTIRDCMACHQPHGSNNPKMLVRSTVRQLCLECHSASKNVLTAQPPSFHDIRSPRYQNCTTCHVAIHGSNASPVFFR